MANRKNITTRILIPLKQKMRTTLSKDERNFDLTESKKKERPVNLNPTYSNDQRGASAASLMQKSLCKEKSIVRRIEHIMATLYGGYNPYPRDLRKTGGKGPSADFAAQQRINRTSDMSGKYQHRYDASDTNSVSNILNTLTRPLSNLTNRAKSTPRKESLISEKQISPRITTSFQNLSINTSYARPQPSSIISTYSPTLRTLSPTVSLHTTSQSSPRGILRPHSPSVAKRITSPSSATLPYNHLSTPVSMLHSNSTSNLLGIQHPLTSRSKTPTVRSYSRSSLLDDDDSKKLVKKEQNPTRVERTIKSGQGMTGLVNLGNTCFMNACIQCLSNLPELRSVFLEKPISGQLATEFSALITKLWSGISLFEPYNFKRAIEKWAPQFSGYRQQDSQEFLRFLLDGLHEDLNRVKTKPPYTELKEIENESLIEKSARWWNNYRERNDSVITDLFLGQLKSTIKCGKCGNISTTFDPFMDISLPIPVEAKRQSSYSFSSFYQGPSDVRTFELTQCLDKFIENELLIGHEQVYCGKCKKHQSACKELSFFRLPRILVLHLKRFSIEGGLDKLLNEVTFPIVGLDVYKYLDKEARLLNKDTVYDLTGVIKHIGGVGGGHYTATCKHCDTGEWLDFNDSFVKSSSEMSTKGPSAYVLFYTLNSVLKSL